MRIRPISQFMARYPASPHHPVQAKSVGIQRIVKCLSIFTVGLHILCCVQIKEELQSGIVSVEPTRRYRFSLSFLESAPAYL